MGRRDRERKERIQQGIDRPFRNPITRGAVKLASRKGVVEELSRGTTTEQISKLDELRGLGTLPGGKLKEAIMKKAPSEMDKAIKKFQKQGREVSVDTLLSEVRSESGFLGMCERVGLTYRWFEDLALARMKAKGVMYEKRV